MAPKAVIFNREAVLAASLEVVRQQGWDALTARSVAGRLGASVSPVYKALGSMENLLRETLVKIRDLLQDYTSTSYSEFPFLNIGAGIVSFARDEPNLFQALFHKRHQFQDIVSEVDSSILSWMKNDVQIGLLNDKARNRLFDNIGYYTMGLAAAVAAGRVADASKNNIVRLLMNMGNALMLAEFSGFSDAESPESKKEWSRIFEENQIFRPN
jgi:AcrR family transcriptional regulator